MANSTADTAITWASWTKIADAGATFVATFTAPVRFAETTTDSAPTGTIGHFIPLSKDGFGLTDSLTAGGYIWVKVAKPGEIGTAIVTTGS
jgi:hypothetical protein